MFFLLWIIFLVIILYDREKGRSESPVLNYCLALIVSFATVIGIVGIARIRPRSGNARCTVCLVKASKVLNDEMDRRWG